jgi:hypothetical protein
VQLKCSVLKLYTHSLCNYHELKENIYGFEEPILLDHSFLGYYFPVYDKEN